MMTIVIIGKIICSILVIAAGFFSASKMVSELFVTYPTYYWNCIAGPGEKFMVIVAALFNIAWVSVLVWNVWF